jgi:hypothetical protein
MAAFMLYSVLVTSWMQEHFDIVKVTGPQYLTYRVRQSSCSTAFVLGHLLITLAECPSGSH